MRKIQVGINDADQRIDRFMRKLYPGLAMGEIFSGFRKGKIKVNGKKVKQNDRIQEGDEISLYFDEGVLDASQKRRKTTYKLARKLETSRILYEDKDILAYDKPAGLVVHQTDHKTDEVSLIEQVHDYLQENSKFKIQDSKGKNHTILNSEFGTLNGEKKEMSLTFSPALAHRIDRETSGVILIAKSKRALEHLTKQFKERTIKKTYLAFAHGTPDPREGIINSPLLRLDENRKDKPKVIVDKKGLSAQTTFETKQNFEFGILNFALVQCAPRTGRMHQIRVHMASLGHPLIGDRRYVPAKLKKSDKELLRHIYSLETPPRGHLLHAHKIEFAHPSNDKKMTIESPWKLIDQVK